MNWIKKLIVKYYQWKLRRKYKHMQLTPQGQYFIKYIIDFYINETIDEPTERYEQQITNFSKRISLPQTVNPVPEALKEPLLHYHAAIIMLKSYLMVCNNKEEWLNTIQDEQIKNMISNTIIV